ncbi:cytochrome P450 [Sparassis latifolia]
MTHEEVMAQIKVLMLAGYETTSGKTFPLSDSRKISDVRVPMTGAFIKLARKPEVQSKLRDELSLLSVNDPTWEQLTNGLPYLDAVVHEIFRLRAPIPDIARVADVIPGVVVPMDWMNRSTAIWGPDAKEFIPERQSQNLPMEAQDIQGHRHLLTFLDGPRICLGRAFALAEFKLCKAVPSVLVRDFTFKYKDGPKVSGEEDIQVPMRIRRVE